MNRKIMLVAGLIFLLISFVLLVRVQKVEASDTIYIYANGNVVGTTNITTSDSFTYTFTSNINDSIVIQRDNIILDGAGFYLIGPGGSGVSFSDRRNVTVKNINMIGFSTGVHLINSTHCSIVGNTIINATNGVFVYEDSNFNNISDNNIVSFGNGIWLREMANCTVSNNNITCEREDNKFGIYLYHSTNNTMNSNIITESQACIYFYYSSYNTLYENTFTNCGTSGLDTDGGGVWSEWSHFNNISENYISESRWYGIELFRSSNNSVSGNEITSSSNRGIMIHTDSNFNQIIGNNVTNNYKGIEVSSSTHNNDISGNYLFSNTYEAIVLDYSSNQTISGNVIIDHSKGILIGSDFNNITNNKIVDCGRGIHVNTGSHNNLFRNNMTENSFGLTIQHSTGNTLGENLMNNNTCGFIILGIDLPHFMHDVDKSNTVGNRPIYYWIDAHNSSVPTDAGCVVLVECTNITVQNLNLSICNWHGVAVTYSRNITVSDNYIVDNDEYAIWLRNSSECYIARNYLKGFIALQLQYSSNNTFFGNTLTAGGNWGSVNLLQSSNNTFYHNNFTDNYSHYLIDSLSVNNWDDGYPTGGNYWDNYQDRYPSARDENSGPYQNVTGSSDGIWDTPYTLNSDNIDNYPIIPEFSSSILLLPLIGTLLALALQRIKNKHTANTE